jgi:hypothetical protein
VSKLKEAAQKILDRMAVHFPGDIDTEIDGYSEFECFALISNYADEYLTEEEYINLSPFMDGYEAELEIY